MTKVLQVIDTLGVGGAERMLLTLLPRLQGQGDKVALLACRGPVDLRATFEAAGIDVLLLPRSKKWQLWSNARAVAAVSKEYEADIVHAHLYFPSLYVALARCFGLLNAKAVVTFHNLAYLPGVNKAGWGLRFKKLLARVFFPLGFVKTTAVSKASADHFQQHLGLKPPLVIHNPVDFARQAAAVREFELPSPEGSPLLLLPGRLVREKGHSVCLQAAARLRSAGRDFQLVFAGGGPLERQLHEEIEQLDLQQNVQITGQLPQAELFAWMARADVVCVPSLFEGFGLTAVEAMGLARPVVTSDAGGLAEVVVNEETGLVVEAGNSEQLTSAVRRLLNDVDLAERLAQRAAADVRQRFDVEAVAKRYHALYLSLVSPSESL